MHPLLQQIHDYITSIWPSVTMTLTDRTLEAINEVYTIDMSGYNNGTASLKITTDDDTIFTGKVENLDHFKLVVYLTEIEDD